MESYPPPSPPPPRPSETNGLGIAGFVVSIVGIFTCVLCPVGLILSLIALGKQPKGFAIAGTVIGGLGTVLLGVFAFLLVSTPEIMDGISTGITIAEGHTIIEEHRDDNDALPGEDEGNALIEHLEDGWGNPLRYELNGDAYVIRSAGPDGEFDTPDDIPPSSKNR